MRKTDSYFGPRRAISLLAFMMLSMGIIFCTPASANTLTWSTVDNDNWSDPANWGGTLPANDGTANIVFSGSAAQGMTNGTTTLDENWNVNSIEWNTDSLDNGTASINNSSATLTLQNGITNDSGGNIVINTNVVLDQMQTWVVGSGIDVKGNISGPGGIITSGAVELLFTGDNSYSGGTTMNGPVYADSTNALGSGTLNWVTGYLENTGTAAVTFPNPVSLNTPTGSYTMLAVKPMTFTGTFDLGGSVQTLTDINSVTLANTISDGGLTLEGGNWNLQATNTFAGGLTVDGGGVTIASDNNLGTAGGGFIVENGTLTASSSLSIDRTVQVHNGVLNANGYTVTFNGPVVGYNGNSSLFAEGGTVIFTSTANTEPLWVTSGTVEMLNTGTNSTAEAETDAHTLLTGAGSVGSINSFGGAIAPGISGSGSLQFNLGSNGFMQFVFATTLDFALGPNTSDSILVEGGTGAEIFGADAEINITDGGGLGYGQTYTLMSWGDVDNELSLSQFQLESSPINGVLSISNDQLQFTTRAVPEPATALLIPSGAILLYLRQRRRRWKSGG